MSRNCAEFHIIGNVVRYAKLDKVMKLTVASNLRVKKDGEWQDDTHYNTVNIWGKADRDYIEKEIQTGDLVRVSGRMRESSFQDSNGNTNYAVDLQAEAFARLGQRRE